MTRHTILTSAVLACSAGLASADIVWEWSFAGEAGLFITEGSIFDPVAIGTFQVLDFVVSSSSVGATLGSLSGGDYSQGSFGTEAPYFISWDGSAVDGWFFGDGLQIFNWNPYTSTSDPQANYFFGWDHGNVEDVTRAAYWIGGDTISVGDITVIQTVPNSGSLAMLGIGGLFISMRRR